jgi:hypothetical protein
MALLPVSLVAQPHYAKVLKDLEANNLTLLAAAKQAEAQQQILNLLSDRQKHHVTQLRQLPLPYEQIDPALEYLLMEEHIYIEDGYLILNTHY